MRGGTNGYWMNGGTDGLMSRWIDRWIDGRMDREMDGEMD